MAFAESLNTYCDMLPCSAGEIAAACGISASALSRYRSGQRTPTNGSAAIARLSRGIALLMRKYGVNTTATEQDVTLLLTSSAAMERASASRFCARLNQLVDAVGLRNKDIAEATGMDPSYVSRIRHGNRNPHNRERLAYGCALLAARHCLEHGLAGSLAGFDEISINDVSDALAALSPQVALADLLMKWLVGTGTFRAKTADILEALEVVDTFDFETTREKLLACPYWADVRSASEVGEAGMFSQLEDEESRFYYGLADSREAEITFLREALSAKELGTITLLHSDSSSWDILQDRDFLERHQAGVMLYLERGGHIDVIHNLYRPYEELLAGLYYWLPLYMTGRVNAYYLNNEHFMAVQSLAYVSDTCAMAAESIVGEPRSHRYHLVKNPREVEHFRHKAKTMVSLAQPLFELYRMDVPEERHRFERLRAEWLQRTSEVSVAEGRFKNLHFVSYPWECSVIALDCEPPMRAVIYHGRMNKIISHLDELLK